MSLSFLPSGFNALLPIFTLGIAIALALVILRSQFLKRTLKLKATPLISAPRPDEHANKLVQALRSALPDSIVLQSDTLNFENARNQYWDSQQSDNIPSCIFQPRSAQDLSVGITILKKAYDERESRRKDGMQNQNSNSKRRELAIFAVRSGGHSPVSGAASIDGGVLIDLSCLNSIAVSDDGASVDIGPGCRWGDVSRVLDEKGLAVVGGRNSHVGVGGLLLGGGISWFSPRFGLASSNILSYEIVLANGTITSASRTENPDLYRALKSSANNFGIVTRFTLRSFSCPKIWSGFLYYPGWQTAKVLSAFHDYVSRNPVDKYASGPLCCFTYLQVVGIQLISVNLAYTRILENENNSNNNKWPKSFATSRFNSLFRLWSTCRQRTLTSGYDELHGITQKGREQYGTTTITNDAATIAETHASFRAGIEQVRGVKGMAWTLVLQPLLPFWIREDDADGVGGGTPRATEASLVLVSYTTCWSNRGDDELVQRTVRQCIERIDAFAEARGTSHAYRFQNYCGEWQRPFRWRGVEEMRFLREMSARFDPEGLFQGGCAGAFKLEDDGGE